MVRHVQSRHKMQRMKHLQMTVLQVCQTASLSSACISSLRNPVSLRRFTALPGRHLVLLQYGTRQVLVRYERASLSDFPSSVCTHASRTERPAVEIERDPGRVPA